MKYAISVKYTWYVAVKHTTSEDFFLLISNLNIYPKWVTYLRQNTNICIYIHIYTRLLFFFNPIIFSLSSLIIFAFFSPGLLTEEPGRSCAAVASVTGDSTIKSTTSPKTNRMTSSAATTSTRCHRNLFISLFFFPPHISFTLTEGGVGERGADTHQGSSANWGS